MDRLFRWSMVLLGVALLMTALSHTSFLVSGDAGIYIDQWNTLRSGYVSDNLAAWNGQGSFVRLRTEGGFGVILWLAGGLSPLLPFVINSFFTTGLLLLAVGLLFVLPRHPDRHMGFGAWAFLALFFSQNSLTELLWNLSRPMRDMPAHFWGMAGLLLCALAVREVAPRMKMIAAAGVSIGLAAWTRVPDILFAVPSGLLLLAPGFSLGWKKKVSMLMVFGAGGFLGVMPLIGQNVLEGKSVFSPGQADVLVHQPATSSDTESEEADEEQPSQVHGLHIVNFRSTLSSAWNKTCNTLDPWLLILAALALATGLVLALRPTLLLTSGALSFFLFYSCYHRAVLRYFFPAYLFLVLMTALGVGAFLERMLSSRNESRFLSNLRRAVAGSMAVCVLTLCFVRADPPLRVAQSLRTAQAFRSWMETQVHPSDVFITNRQGVKAWLDAFSPPGIEQLIWNRGLASNAPPQKIATRLAHGQRVFFLTLSDTPPRVVSWWLDDLQNDFRAEPLADSLPLHPGPTAIVGFEIQPRRTQDTLYLPPTTQPYTGWFMVVRALSTTNPSQAIAMSCGDRRRSVVVRGGPNLFPSDLGNPGDRLELSSAEPLPSMLLLQPVGTEPIDISLNDYGTFFSTARMVQPARTLMRGYPLWNRDWGGDGLEKHESRPALLLQDGASIRMPAWPEPLRVRLFLTVFTHKPSTREEFKSNVRLEHAGKQLVPIYEIHASDFTEDGAGVFMVTLEIALPPSPTPDILCRIEPDSDCSLRLDRVELTPGQALPRKD